MPQCLSGDQLVIPAQSSGATPARSRLAWDPEDEVLVDDPMLVGVAAAGD
jgi:hypothetical protein